jgi:hypothetical protein
LTVSSDVSSLKFWAKKYQQKFLQASGSSRFLNVYFATANELVLFIYALKRNATNNHTRSLFSRDNQSVLFFGHNKPILLLLIENAIGPVVLMKAKTLPTPL